MKTRGELIDSERPFKKRRLMQKEDVLTGLQALPDELLVMIFERLASKAELQSIDRTCRQFNQLLHKPYLWLRLKWPEKDYSALSQEMDVTFNREKVFWLSNGDVVVALANGEFDLLPVTKTEWLHFSGHLDPYNFHTALPIKSVISLHDNQLATCAEDGICVWDRLTGRFIQHIPNPTPSHKPFKLLCTRHNSIVSASAEGSVYLYADDKSPVQRFEESDIKDLGELKNILFWKDKIVGNFVKAIISWSVHGRSATTCVVIADLQKQLTIQMSSLLIDVTKISLGFILPEDVVRYHHPRNKDLEFYWEYAFPDHQVEVMLNKAFGFLIDLFDPKKPPLFLGSQHRNVSSHDAKGNYFMVRRLVSDCYEASFNWSSRERTFKTKTELSLLKPVKWFSTQPTGHAFFVQGNNSAILWNIQADTIKRLVLEVPSDIDPEMIDFYQYESEDWHFQTLLCHDVMAVHKFGMTIIWDMHTGALKQHIQLRYTCDPAHYLRAIQMPNLDLLVERRDQGVLNRRREVVNKQNHVCIYRFLPPPPLPRQEEDAMELDSAIIKPGF